jgi:hypothetical protein
MGTLIALWLMKHAGFGADKAMGWLRNGSAHRAIAAAVPQGLRGPAVAWQFLGILARDKRGHCTLRAAGRRALARRGAVRFAGGAGDGGDVLACSGQVERGVRSV